MAKYSYKGKSLEELQKMDMNEFAQLAPSRQRRSMKRMDENRKKFIKKVLATDEPVRTHYRDIVVLPAMVGKRIAVHNGKEFKYVVVQQEMIGHFLGELALTRKNVKHSAAGIGATRSTKFISVK
jgi:small subunit ribosomal protein S19